MLSPRHGDECCVAVATGGKSGSSAMQAKTINVCIFICTIYKAHISLLYVIKHYFDVIYVNCKVTVNIYLLHTSEHVHWGVNSSMDEFINTRDAEPH